MTRNNGRKNICNRQYIVIEVEGSLQYVVKSWAIVVELISVYKRLTEFERQIEIGENK